MWRCMESVAALSSSIASCKPYVCIVEEAVYVRYGVLWEGGGIEPPVVVASGEANKTWERAHALIGDLLGRNVHRGHTLIAIGGGAHLDVVGFVASVYRRGLRLVVVPTTLLSSVDAAIGGKNGVNITLGGGLYKNMVGTTRLPMACWHWDGWVRTWSAAHWREGMAEVIKYHMLGVQLGIEGYRTADYQRDEGLRSALVAACVAYKEQIVAADLDETKGIRQRLNLGHTLGHALEAGYGLSPKLSHGEAVAAGMAFAIWLSIQEQGLPPSTYPALLDLLKRYDLEAYTNFQPNAVVKGMVGDKKSRGKGIRMVLLGQSGPVLQDFTEEALRLRLVAYCQAVSTL